MPCPVSQSVAMNSRMLGNFCCNAPRLTSKGCSLYFVEHNENGGVAAKALDEFEPVLGIGIFVALATVEHQQVKATLGEKELMGRVHNLLPTKIPHMEFDIFSVVESNRPLGNLNALCLSRSWAKILINQAIDQGRFSHRAETHQNHLGFIQWSTLKSQPKIVIKDIFWSTCCCSLINLLPR